MLGETQIELLTRIETAANGMITTNWRDNRTFMAIKRLQRRGLITKERFGGEAIGFVTVYRLTADGREQLARGRELQQRREQAEREIQERMEQRRLTT